ncbi:MAG: UvrD-helicase domain-containing protein [candidate division Zixibacteria bacterium]
MSRLLDNLNDRQLAAVTKTEGPLLVVAVAGSGKTRVLTHRLAYIISEQKAKPWEVLAVTFTNKAAGEMKGRIESLLGFDIDRMWVSTFHSFCSRFLRQEAKHLGYPSNFTILDSDDSKSLIKRSINELGLNGTSQFTPDSVLRKISNAKNSIYTAEMFASEADGYYDEKVARVFMLYEQKLRQSAAFDFDDLIVMTVRILSENVEVSQKWQNRFRYIMVDEYQDTNHAQYLLLKTLTGPDKNICVVGDEDQSIYGWRGADISNILNFENDYPGADVIKLEQNYRSTQLILDSASSVIKNNTSRKDKILWSDIDGGDKIIIGFHESQGDEADWVINHCLAMREKTTLRDIVILYRTNAQSRAFEEALRRENTPYQIIGGMSFYQRKEIKDIVAYLKLISNAKDEASFVRVVNYPKRALGQTSLEKLSDYARENNLSHLEASRQAQLIESLNGRARSGFQKYAELIGKFVEDSNRLPVDKLIQRIIDETGLDKALADGDPVTSENRLENLDEFIAAAAEFFHHNAEPTLDNFLAEITLYTDLDNYQDTDEKLTLMTLHNAKGLEYDNVFITGLEDGLFPLARSFDDPAMLEEERRLFYVGTTRARYQLILTAARFRHRFGGRESMPSRFLREIPENITDTIDRRSYKYEFGLTRTVNNIKTPTRKKPEGVYYEYENGEGIRPGCIVEHPKFGQGRVISINGAGENMRVDVDFSSLGPIKLIAKYAHLTVISQ